MPGALEGLRVLELGEQIAAPYCAKLLADLGADVIKLERPGGDPLRAWGPFAAEPDPDAAGLFRYLNANKRGGVVDLTTPGGVEVVRGLVAGADLLVENLRPGALESFGLDPEELRAANPHLALVRISGFGQSGPYRDEPITDLVLQAAAGWVARHDALDGEPVRVGGRMPEYVCGAFAASAALTAVLAARQTGEPVEVDFSMMECLVGTLAYPMLMLEAMRGAPQPTAPARYIPLGIQACKDGWVGINVLTEAHWSNACRAMGAPEFAGRRGEISRNSDDYEAFQAALRPWLARHTAEEIVEQCQALRIPAAVVGTGQTSLESSQFSERPFFIDEPDGGFRRPGFPYRLGATPASLRSAAPRLARAGEGGPGWLPRDAPPLSVDAEEKAGLPFRGLRVLDLGSFWAGPYVGMYLASLGADVVKVESTSRPDGFRFIAPADPSAGDWYEGGALFQATNLGKRDVTLDLGSPAGRALLLRLVERADVLIENYAPRVLERFDLDYPAIRTAKPDIVMLRMPAYGLEGPGRDHVGWAMAIAQAAGISWLTGDPTDERPRNPGAFVDPAVAMHALVALQAALAHRRRTGEGQQIEMAQLETAICMCPEPVIEYSMNGKIQSRRGNRSPSIAPQGIYSCRDGQVALSVRTDAEWQALVLALDRPAWASDRALAGATARLARSDAIDRGLRTWTAELDASEVVERLRAQGVPAAQVLTTPRMYGEPQLEARGFYQTLDHPVTGKRRYPVWPMRFSFAPGDVHPSGAPTLGQHNEEVLGGELGLSGEELERLRREGVIGERWTMR